MPNILAIVGRPNVGKSTLFNRLTKTRRAIVSDQAGTTRDRQYGRSEWNGKDFSVIVVETCENITLVDCFLGDGSLVNYLAESHILGL